MTGFWKTDRLITLGLFHFIGPVNGYTLIHYTYTVQLPGLVDRSAVLKRVLLNLYIHDWHNRTHGDATWEAWV